MYFGVSRNIDKDMAWILPLLADKSTMIKAQIFVLRKDTADILGRNFLSEVGLSENQTQTITISSY